MIGLDTGFFIELLKGNLKAVEVWQDIINGDDCVTSCLTLFELKRLSLKGRLNPDDSDALIEAIMAISKVIWLDNLKIHESAASLSHGTGIPAIDSLILASFLISDVKTVYTTDSHFESYKKKEVEIVTL